MSGQRDEILAHFDAGDIWGIGWQYAKLLRRHGILTALDLVNAPDSWIRKHMTVVGMRTVMELRGTSCIPLDEAEKPRKSILCSRSFGRRVSRLDELREAVAAYTSRVAEKLREQHSAASCIQIFIIEFPFNDGHPRTHICSTELPVATAYTPELIRYATVMLERIYRPHCEYRKAGVMLSGICQRGQVQTNLFFESREGKKEQALMKAVDDVNRRWGRGTLIHAASGFSRPWWMRQAHKSPRFTTSWMELPLVK